MSQLPVVANAPHHVASYVQAMFRRPHNHDDTSFQISHDSVMEVLARLQSIDVCHIPDQDKEEMRNVRRKSLLHFESIEDLIWSFKDSCKDAQPWSGEQIRDMQTIIQKHDDFLNLLGKIFNNICVPLLTQRQQPAAATAADTAGPSTEALSVASMSIPSNPSVAEPLFIFVHAAMPTHLVRTMCILVFAQHMKTLLKSLETNPGDSSIVAAKIEDVAKAAAHLSMTVEFSERWTQALVSSIQAIAVSITKV
jgi:hypothetical protein